MTNENELAVDQLCIKYNQAVYYNGLNNKKEGNNYHSCTHISLV